MSAILPRDFWIDMRFDIITIFPLMFRDFLSFGLIKKALEKGVIEVNVFDLRDFTSDRHRQVDDRPFGGSAGMVLKPEPIFKAVESIRRTSRAAVVLLSPQGRTFDAECAESMSVLDQVILICGRYEGVDERVIENLITGEISIGDYVLTGGEPAAMVVLDAVSRFVPHVVGKRESVETDTFSVFGFGSPQYTRPRLFRGMRVPDVLFSGDHRKIEDWRRKMSFRKTERMRPDLLGEKESEFENTKRTEERPKRKKE